MASEYHRGEMDIAEQNSTYGGFMLMTKWGSLAIAVSVLVLTLWFCTPSGFIGGLAAGVITTAVGILLLREKKTAEH